MVWLCRHIGEDLFRSFALFVIVTADIRGSSALLNGNSHVVFLFSIYCIHFYGRRPDKECQVFLRQRLERRKPSTLTARDGRA